MTTAQGRLITVTAGLTIIALMLLQRSLALSLALSIASEATGVAVMLKRTPFEVALAVGLQRAAGSFKVVITPRRTVGSGLQTQIKPLNRRRVGRHPAAGYVRRCRLQRGKSRLSITEL